jgi:anti-anti-sigma factor
MIPRKGYGGMTNASERLRAVAHATLEAVGEGPAQVQVLSFPRSDRGKANLDAVRSYFSGQFLDHTSGLHRLVIDLSGVTALDSAALGPLVQKLREIQEHQGHLVLCGVEAPALREIFALTRFDRVFPILVTRAEAVAAAGR